MRRSPADPSPASRHFEGAGTLLTGAFAVALLTVALATGCDTAPTPADASADAGADGGTDAGRVDAGAPMCEPVCPLSDTCCGEPGATGTCYPLRTDPEHCGNCQVNCVTTHRGDGCEASQCTCGTLTLGCRGTRQSYCCAARRPGGEGYCANLDLDATDCGGCNTACDGLVSDRCDGGRCVCGPGRETCAGTLESTCCSDGPDVGCTDLRSDQFHCGRCNNLCETPERCEGGSCTRGTACPASCSAGEICCNGSCCARGACDGAACTVPVDAGPVDAGPVDAGPVDAGPDAG